VPIKLLNVRSPQTPEFNEVTAFVPFQQPQECATPSAAAICSIAI
jgi:hypothetical protein